MRIKGNPERRATRMITGISRTRPISKNIGRPMRAPTRAIAHGRARSLARVTMVSTTWSAPPESARSLPNIAPSPIRSPTDAEVVPNPLPKLVPAWASPSPAPIPTPMEATVRARNGWILSQLIRPTMTATPMIAAVMRRGSEPLAAAARLSRWGSVMATPLSKAGSSSPETDQPHVQVCTLSVDAARR